MASTESFAETVELLRRAKAGEGECLGRVLERYRDRLLVRIRCMMGVEARRFAESGDFLNGLFLKVLEHFDAFELRDDESFLRWTTQIARNAIRDDVRRRHEEALDVFMLESGLWTADTSVEETPDQVAARAEQALQLVDALADLTEDQREVIELRHFERMSFADIGQRLGRSENAVQLLHTRVLVRLSKLLGPRDV